MRHHWSWWTLIFPATHHFLRHQYLKEEIGKISSFALLNPRSNTWVVILRLPLHWRGSFEFFKPSLRILGYCWLRSPQSASSTKFFPLQKTPQKVRRNEDCRLANTNKKKGGRGHLKLCKTPNNELQNACHEARALHSAPHSSQQISKLCLVCHNDLWLRDGMRVVIGGGLSCDIPLISLCGAVSTHMIQAPESVLNPVSRPKYPFEIYNSVSAAYRLCC